MSKKIELTIKTSYLPNWGMYEGIRELIQNARDAEVEHLAPFKIDWVNDSLRIENIGTTLPIKSLLLGHTSKLSRSDLIGKFGEGLKLGVLALIRAGHSVKIRNGSEVWTPSLEHSKIFDEEILTFTIDEGRKNSNRVRIEVGGVSVTDWAEMQNKFLFLHPPKKSFSGYGGELILDPALRKKIFVKGIFVQDAPDYNFGYNLFNVELDRDRRMIESYNLRWTTQEVLMDALRDEDPELLNEFFAMLENPTEEIKELSTYSVPEVTAKVIAAQFIEKYGENAIPVDNIAVSKDIEHLGAKGIVVNKPTKTILSKILGDTSVIQERLKKEVIRTYSWEELSGNEKFNLSFALRLIEEDLELVDVVDFRSPNLGGQFADDRTLISKNKLSDSIETLAVIIHEAAHRKGADGDHSHVTAMEELWIKAVRKLEREAKAVKSTT